MGGTMLAKSDDDWLLEMVFGAPPLEADAAEEPTAPVEPTLVREYSKTRTNVAEVLGLSGPDDKVRATFESWDKDSSGYITKDELYTALAQVAPTYKPDDLERAFESA